MKPSSLICLLSYLTTALAAFANALRPDAQAYGSWNLRSPMTEQVDPYDAYTHWRATDAQSRRSTLRSAAHTWRHSIARTPCGERVLAVVACHTVIGLRSDALGQTHVNWQSWRHRLWSDRGAADRQATSKDQTADYLLGNYVILINCKRLKCGRVC